MMYKMLGLLSLVGLLFRRYLCQLIYSFHEHPHSNSPNSHKVPARAPNDEQTSLNPLERMLLLHYNSLHVCRLLRVYVALRFSVVHC